MHLLKRRFTWVDGLSIIGFLLSSFLIFFAWQNDAFDSRAEFVTYVRSFGNYTLILFLLLQTIQLFLPMLPSALTCTAGVILFGPFRGVLYNYIGISMGSILAFLLVRRYGEALVKKLVSEKKYEKYKHKLMENKRFDRFFTLVIFTPLSPDNIICYLAGLSNMTIRKVILIILLGKPLPIAIYSLGATTILEWIGII